MMPNLLITTFSRTKFIFRHIRHVWQGSRLPSHKEKVEIVKKIAKKYNINAFVETGAYKGEMVDAVKDCFSKIITIELGQDLFEKAKINFSKHKNIRVIHGNSGEKLKEIISDIQEPILFWLDAHYSGGITAKGPDNTPILKELDSIFRHKKGMHIVLIDDARLFNGSDGYPTMQYVQKKINEYDNLKLNIKRDIIFIKPLNVKATNIYVKKIVPLFFRDFLRQSRRLFCNLKNKTYQYYLFLKDFLLFKKLSLKDNRFTVLWRDRSPQIWDRTSETLFDPHYLYHPAWAARILAMTKPKKHIDISSVLSFSTIISAFVPVEFYDYRPTNIKLPNFSSKEANLLSLPFLNNSIESLSCMHTIEHIGLGRYGDAIDPEGDIKAIAELKRVTAKNGNLLIVMPIGKPRIVFNAHRIYSYAQILNYFNQLELKEFSLIPDNGRQVGIIKNASQKQADSQRYGCGLFWFIKK